MYNCVSGCDQKHEEEIDSEAIYKDFVLRVSGGFIVPENWFEYCWIKLELMAFKYTGYGSKKSQYTASESPK